MGLNRTVGNVLVDAWIIFRTYQALQLLPIQMTKFLDGLGNLGGTSTHVDQALTDNLGQLRITVPLFVFQGSAY